MSWSASVLSSQAYSCTLADQIPFEAMAKWRRRRDGWVAGDTATAAAPKDPIGFPDPDTT